MSSPIHYQLRQIIHSFVLLGIASVLGTSPVRAQEPAPAPVVLSFRLFSLAGSYSGLLYEMKPGAKLQRVTLDQGLSPYYIRPPGSTLEIFREFPIPPGSPPGTKPVRKTGILATIPEKTSRCIIVTIPKSHKRTDLLASRTIPDDSPDHHAGTVLVANCSTFDAVVAIDDKQFPVASGGTVIIPCPVNSYEFLIQIAKQKGEGWSQVYKAEFSNNPKLRGYVVFTDYTPDPDYRSTSLPPPATVAAVFEVSPEVPRMVKTAARK